MMWFYNLPKKARVIIAVISWLPLLVFGYLIGDSIGANGENVQPWQAVLTVLFLVFPIVVTVFTVKAHKRDIAPKNAGKSDNTTPPPRKKLSTI